MTRMNGYDLPMLESEEREHSEKQNESFNG